MTATISIPGPAPVRDLIWTLVRTDFKTRYHGTVGGFLWALAKPFAMCAVLLVVFSAIFSGDPQYRMNLVVGLFLYDFFSEGTRVGLTALHAKGFLLAKAKVPSWILVVSSVANALLTLFVFIAVILVVSAVAGHAPAPGALALFATYVVLYLLIVVGISLGSSVLFLRYRDLNQVWEVLTQAGFFLAPVVYPLELMPARFHWLLYLWPPTPVIQCSRSVLIAGVTPSTFVHAALVLEAFAVLALGIVVFRRYAPRAAEYL